MATNPNELARIISEMSKTLQEMSETHLSTVESILSDQVKLNKKQARVKQANKKINVLKATLEAKQTKENERVEQKAISYQKDMAKMLLVDLSKIEKQFIDKRPVVDSIAAKMGLGKELDTLRSVRKTINAPGEFVKTLFGKKKDQPKTLETKKDILKGINYNKILSQPLTTKTQTPEEDFVRHSEDSPEKMEINLLKGIDAKLAKLKLGGDGGLMDLLSKGIPKLLSMVGTAGTIAEGAAGAGVAGGLLGKFGKYLPKMGKIGAGVGKVLSTVKNPKMAIPVLAGMAATGVYGAVTSNDDSSSDVTQPTQVEGKFKGGNLSSGKPYLVGERGPELFAPGKSGSLTPNNKLVSTDGSLIVRNNIDQNKIIVSSFKTSIDTIGGKLKSFKELIGAAWDSLKATVSDLINSIKNRVTDKVKTVTNVIKSAPSKLVTWTKGLLGIDSAPTADVSSSQGQPASSTQQVAPQPGTSSPSVDTGTMPNRFSGEFNVPKTQLYKIHDNEMVVPAYHAEMLRTAAELGNKYSVAGSSNVPSSNGIKLDEKFWMTKFVPAFASAIKVDRSKKRGRGLEVADPFGVL